MAKKKNKGPAQPRNSAARPGGLAQLLNQWNEESSEEEKIEIAVVEKTQYPDRNVGDRKRNSSPDKRGAAWYTHNEQGFVNPYNFVRFANKPPQRTAPAAGPLTGWLECKIETKSPILMMDSGNTTVGSDEHATTPPLLLAGADGAQHPAIHGSTLRGMLRSIYETASNSCVPIDGGEDLEFSARLETSTAAKMSGILQYDKGTDVWTLYKAEAFKVSGAMLLDDGSMRCNGKILRCGDTVLFAKASHTNSKGEVIKKAILGDGKDSGSLQYVPPFTKKPFSPRVLEKTDTVIKQWPVGENTPYTELDRVLGIYLEYSEASGDETKPGAYKCLKDALKRCHDNGGCVPVWYLIVGVGQKEKNATAKELEKAQIYLTCSSIGRILMHRTWNDMVRGHKACAQKAKLCPACRLFGFVAGKQQAETEETAYTGHLRFCDAVATETAEAAILPPCVLPELSSPKISAMGFYTESPREKGQKSWNYDFAVTHEYGSDNRMADLRKPIDQIKLLGRKYYWHSEKIQENTEPKGKQENKRNITARPVRTGTHYSFRIYFDGITQNQLDELVWCCTLGENEPDSPLRQKIGYAKPLGYGSVKITVEKAVLRELTPRLHSYTLRDVAYGQKQEMPFEQSRNKDGTYTRSLDELLAICDSGKTKGKNVRYPIGENRETSVGEKNRSASHQWFAGNKVLGAKQFVLPQPTDADVTLPALVKEKR